MIDFASRLVREPGRQEPTERIMHSIGQHLLRPSIVDHLVFPSLSCITHRRIGLRTFVLFQLSFTSISTAHRQVELIRGASIDRVYLLAVLVDRQHLSPPTLLFVPTQPACFKQLDFTRESE